jgi:DeoR/GlpR family transcriptional regulator of sugar metabolism
MNPAERQRLIVEHLDAVGACVYSDLAQRLGVSEMTVRRDVDKLVLRNQAIKTLGGVQTAHAAGHLYESPIQHRLATCRAEKEQIAREALRNMQPHQTVFLDGSTTCLVLARQIARNARGMTVVTNSALVCLEFGGGTDTANAVFVLGGQFDPVSACYVGPTAEEAARRFFVDVACFSTKGFLPEEGTFESSLATIRIKQLIAEQAARVVLLTDHTKFGQRALCKALDIQQIHEVVTDSVAPADVLARLKQRGVAVRMETPNRRLATTVPG